MSEEDPALDRLELATGQRLRLFQAGAEATFDSILITDAELDPPGPRILYANHAFSEMTGYTLEEIEGHSPRFLQGPDTDRAVLDRLRRNLQAGEVFVGQTMNYRKDGTPFVLEWTISPILDNAGQPSHFVAIQRDVSEREANARRLVELAHYDSLTGLANRHYAQSLAEAEVERSQRYGEPVSLVMFDIDRFKRVNDRLGHRWGDDLLARIAGILRERLRTNDIAGRWGGEEFLIILPHTDADGATEVAEDLRERVQAATAGEAAALTLSSGVAQHEPGESAQGVLDAADIALYEAKSLGRNRVIRAPTRGAEPPH